MSLYVLQGYGATQDIILQGYSNAGTYQANLNSAALNLAASVIKSNRNTLLDVDTRGLEVLAYAVLSLVEYNADNGTATINVTPRYSGTTTTNVRIQPEGK